MSTPGTPQARAPRGDGVRNRLRLVEEAERLFGEQGVYAPLDEVARRAGVSSGTLYRHFANRVELLKALNVRIGERAALALGQVAQAETVRQKIELFVTLTAESLIDYPASRPVIIALQELERGEQPGAQFEDAVRGLVLHAKAEGILHPEAQASDLVMAAIMVSSLGSLPGVRESGLWRRYAAVALGGLSPANAGLTTRAPSAPSQEEYERILGPAPAAPPAD